MPFSPGEHEASGNCVTCLFGKFLLGIIVYADDDERCLR